MEIGSLVAVVIAVVIVLFVIVTLAKAVRIVPQARAGIVERLGRYSRTLNPGLSLLVPYIDRLKPLVDMREQVVSFPPSSVITQDNLVVNIDSVIYFQVTDPKAAMYEIASPITGIEQLTVTTLRNVIGGMDLEQTLTSRESINSALRGVLDEATGKWGIRVNRVELKAIDPPASVQESMEKQMRAEREKRAAILTAEGFKQSQILTAEGEKTSAILRAEGDAQSQILRAEGEAQAIQKVFDAIHAGGADDQVLAYQYLQALPSIANGTANKVWVVPAELSKAMENLGSAFSKNDASKGLTPAPVDLLLLTGRRGIVAGAVNSAVGSGTLLTYPLLLAYGLPPVVANGTNSARALARQPVRPPHGGTGARWRADAANLRPMMAIMAVGALLGALAVVLLPASVFERVVPWFILLACLLVLVGPRVTASLKERGIDSTSLPRHVLLPLLFGVGVYAGYFGAAQGVVIMAALTVLFDVDVQRSNAVKNVLQVVSNGIAAVVFAVAGVGRLARGAGPRGGDASVGGLVGAPVARRLPAVGAARADRGGRRRRGRRQLPEGLTWPT